MRTCSLLRSCTIFFIFSLISASYSGAQSITLNPKFEAVSEEEVKMTSYSLDTSAAAVVLFKSVDYNSFISRDGVIETQIIKRYRYKVLKESAKDIADFELYYSRDLDIKEKISGIKVTTFNYENGKVTKTKMSKSFIFNEKDSKDRSKISFGAQNVKVGSVIDVEYQISNRRYWVIPDVYAQDAYPVNWFEARIAYPDLLTFNRMVRGYHRLDTRLEDQQASVIFPGTTYTFNYNIKVEHYRGNNIPALKGSMSNVFGIQQYLSSIVYDLSSVKFPNEPIKKFAITWEDLDARIKESDIFKTLKSSCRFKDEVDTIMAESENTDTERIVKIVKLVLNKVQWNGKRYLYPESLSQVLKSGSGSSADMNALAATALLHAGYTVDPVFIRRRSSGKLYDFHIAMDIFDTFILSVKNSSGEQFIVDASNANGYINVLDVDYLVDKARIINKAGKGSWIDLTHLVQNSSNVAVNAKLSEEGVLSGHLRISARNEESLGLKLFYKNSGSEEKFISEMENNYDFKITEFKQENMRDYTPACSMIMSIEKDYDWNEGSNINYISPFMFRMHHDKFKEETRVVPIDFNYTEKTTLRVIIEMPEGYEVESLPQPAQYNCHPLNAFFKTRYKYEEGKILAILDYSLGQMLAPATEYIHIRSFWQQLTNVYNEQIVLKKK